MKEFPVSETAMTRLKAMVGPILYYTLLLLGNLKRTQSIHSLLLSSCSLVSLHRDIQSKYTANYLNKNLIKPFMPPPSFDTVDADN